MHGGRQWPGGAGRAGGAGSKRAARSHHRQLAHAGDGRHRTGPAAPPRARVSEGADPDDLHGAPAGADRPGAAGGDRRVPREAIHRGGVGPQTRRSRRGRGAVASGESGPDRGLDLRRLGDDSGHSHRHARRRPGAEDRRHGHQRRGLPGGHSRGAARSGAARRRNAGDGRDHHASRDTPSVRQTARRDVLEPHRAGREGHGGRAPRGCQRLRRQACRPRCGRGGRTDTHRCDRPDQVADPTAGCRRQRPCHRAASRDAAGRPPGANSRRRDRGVHWRADRTRRGTSRLRSRRPRAHPRGPAHARRFHGAPCRTIGEDGWAAGARGGGWRPCQAWRGAARARGAASRTRR